MFMLAACIGPSCKKENSQASVVVNKAEVIAELDGEPIQMANKANTCSMYTFGGVAGNYFGVHSNYEISSKVGFEITFGTGLTKNSSISDKEFASLIAVGEKDYGSLGSFTTNPQLKSNRVEIAYKDKEERRWCSTQITEKQTRHGIETSVKIEQKNSKFFIDEIERTTSAENINGYKVKGRFECFLYEVNTKAKKKMKGNFTGIVYQNN